VSTPTISRGRGQRPLYLQLVDEILGTIRGGQLRPGDRVASEPELMQRHGVSRSTAVRALAHLEQAGVVRREQGRGTFVEEPALVRRRPQLGSFSEQVRARGGVPSQRLVRLGPLAPGDDPAGLRRWLGDGVAVLEVLRLRLVDGEPVGVHRTLLAEALARSAGVGAGQLGGEQASLYALLDAAGIHVVEAEEHLQAVAASREEAALLGVAAGSPLMRVLRLSSGPGGMPIEVSDARYAGERFDYGVALVRPRPGHGAAREQPTSEGEDDADQAPRGGRPGGARAAGGRVRQVGGRGLG
jgi:GntR family transcriptional regulator, N-acetylglucosamine utilization regulator